MQRKFRFIALALCIGALAACHKKSDAPLAFVPADSPYVVANLKPMAASAQNALLAQANLQLPGQIAQLRATAGELSEKNPRAAATLRVVADEFDGRNIQQAAEHMGLDIHGLLALYGLGLSPVMRVQIADPSRFNDFIGRLQKASGVAMQTATLGKLSYRKLEFGDKLHLQFVVSLQQGNDGKTTWAVLALLPADIPQPMLSEALGQTRPKQSLLESGSLQKLAASKGYMAGSIGYVDLTRFPALLAGGKDPLMHDLMAVEPELAAKLPASCEADLARVAARMPMISTGYTALSNKERTQRTDIALAPDITRAFDGLAVKLPGLHGTMVAPLDFAMALPVKETRDFWIAQADAVAAKPFTCPSLAWVNTSYAKLNSLMQKAKMPPISDLRGIRLSVDEITMQKGGQGRPGVKARIMIASSNPAGLLAAAQMALPMLRDVQINTDGKPVAMPDKLIAMAGGAPIWVAMTDHVLAIAYGDGEDQRIAPNLKNAPGQPGDVMNLVMDGSLLQKWAKMISDNAMDAVKSAPSSDDPATETRRLTRIQEMHQRMQGLQDQLKQIDSASAQAHIDAHGVVVVNDVHMR